MIFMTCPMQSLDTNQVLIKLLYFSATTLQLRPKQKARSAIHRFCFFGDFRLSRDLQVYIHLREID